MSTLTSFAASPGTGLPGVAFVSISRLQALCETVAPRYAARARFFPVREGYGAAVAALQAYVEAGSVDVVLAAGSNGAYLQAHLNVPVVMVKVNGFDVLTAITHATTTWPGRRIGLVLHESVSHELDELGPWLNVDLIQRAYRSIDARSASSPTPAAARSSGRAWPAIWRSRPAWRACSCTRSARSRRRSSVRSNSRA